MSDLGADRFVVVGGQRCGTTSLHELLDSHPAISMIRPARPEPKLFLGADFADKLTHHERRDPVAPGRLSGEKSVTYLETPGVAARIADRYPRARIIAILREPIDRAISNYRYTRDNGLESLAIDDALDPAAEERPFDRAAISASPYHYLRRGRYIDHLRRFTDVFPSNRVHVVLLEELIGRPESIVELLRFLGLEPVRDATFARWGWSDRSDGDDELTPTRRRALDEYFASPNEQLADHLGRDLADWWTADA
jgi:hypothetical protein